MRRGQRARGVLARILVAVLVALPVVTAAGPTTQARPVPVDCAAGDPGPAASDAVNKALDRIGASQVPASYVFAVDISESVGDYYGQIKTGLRQFLGALNPQDQVALVTFGAAATSTVPLAPLAGRTAEIVGALPKPDQQNTDIGRGIAQAVGELENAPAGQPGAVVLFTDGEHRPLANSEYYKIDGKAWADLTARAADLGRDHPLKAYAVPLSPELSGVNLLCTVFPGAERRPVGSSTDRLSLFLRRAQTTARLQAAAGLLADDRDRGVTVDWSGLPSEAAVGALGTDAVLHLRNDARHLPLVLDRPQIVADGDLADVSSNLPRSITLAGGETKDVPVHLSWPVQERHSMLPGSDRYTTTLSLAAAVSAPDAALLAAAGLPGGPIAVPVTPTGQGVLVGRGPTAWLWWVWLLLAVLAVAVVLIMRWMTPPMSGVLWIDRMRPPGEGDDRWIDIDGLPLSGRRSGGEIKEGLQVRIWPWRDWRTRAKLMRVTVSAPHRRQRATRLVERGGHWLILGYGVRHDEDGGPDGLTVPTRMPGS